MKNLPSDLAAIINKNKENRDDSLDLSGRQLTYVPTKVFEFNWLDTLNLSGNQITQLPQELGQLTQLTSLNVAGNGLETLPEWISRLRQLRLLFLHNNQLTVLPTTIRALQNLIYFSIDDNPLEFPPLEIATKGIGEIALYFEQHEQGDVDYLYEAKLLIIGEPGAGKTTLLRKIQDPDSPLPTEKESTKGMDIARWSYPQSDNKKDFQVNLWDFGGQEIYHATHRFFLTKRSFYVLVADTRQENTDFYYWLNIVEMLSDGSPLIIVKNEKDERLREINERQLRGEFTSLKEVLSANFATNRGLQDILTQIKHFTSCLQHVGQSLPKSWLQVRKALEEDSRNYMGFNEYKNLCTQNGFESLPAILQLSTYLHELGICLHYQDDPILKNTLILKPKWCTDAVYKVLDNTHVVENLGKFERHDLNNIWKEPEYAPMCDELLQMMIKFQLCYKVPGHGEPFIVPQLLSENQPSYSDGEETDFLFLRYVYEFMPKGILWQFIISMHPYILEQRLVWRSGVVLQKDHTQAEIIEHFGKRTIYIRIWGQHKRDFLVTLRHEFDKIHQAYKRLAFNELIPCNCDTCKISPEPHFYELEALRDRISNQKYDIECGKKPYQKIQIQPLIDDVGESRYQKESYQEKENRHIIFKGSVENVTIQSASQAAREQTTQQPANREMKNIASAWGNGSFYIFAFVVIIATLSFVANQFSVVTLGVIIIAGMLIVPTIGALQLRQDDRITEKNFLKLMGMVIKNLPLVGKFIGKPSKE